MFNDEKQLFEVVKQLKMEELQAEYDRLKTEERDIQNQIRVLEGKLVLTPQEKDCERKFLKMEYLDHWGSGKFMGKKTTFLKRLFYKRDRKNYRIYQEASAEFQTVTKEYDMIQKRVDNAEISIERLENRLRSVVPNISITEFNLIKIHQTKNLAELLKITAMTQAEAVQYVQSKGIDDRTV